MSTLLELDPAILSALLSFAALPAVHDFIVAWDANPRFKAGASALMAVALGLIVSVIGEGADAGAIVTSILSALVAKEAGFSGLHQPLAEGSGKPTIFAAGETIGIGSSNGRPISESAAATVNEGD